MSLISFVKNKLSNINSTGHPVNKDEMIIFIQHYFPIVNKKIECKVSFKLDSEKDSSYTVFASSNNGVITFFINPIYKLISMFETKSARKAWILMLIAHELYHNGAPFKRNHFKSDIEYENYINDRASDWVYRFYPNLIFSLKCEYNRWGKKDTNGIWYTLSFGRVNKWRESYENR